MLTTATREQEVRLPEEVQQRFLVNKLTVADVTAMFFIRNGMRRLYTISGSTIVNTNNAIHPYIQEGFTTSITTVREDGAVFAAGGEASITGQPGVAFLIGGPGLGNAHTAIYALARERIPVVIAAGQVPTSEIGTGSFQYYRSDKIIPELNAFFHRLEDPMDILAFIDKGFNEAYMYQTPVVLEFPKDLQKVPFDTSRLEQYLNSPSNRKLPDTNIPLLEQDIETVRHVANLINSTNEVVFIFGHRFGKGRDSAEVKDMVEWLTENGNIPYTVTFPALPYSQAKHSLYIGRGGKTGDPRVDQAIKSAKVIVGFGTDFTEGSSLDKRAANPDLFDSQATVISIDNLPNLPQELRLDTSKNPKVDISIHIDPFKAAKILTSLLKDKARADWFRQVNRPDLTTTLSKSTLLPRPMFLSRLSAIAQDNAHIVVDAGNTTIDVAKFFDFTGSRRLSSFRETGPMGFAPSYALGAKMAAPEIPTYVLMGDRSLLMSGELPTIKGAALSGYIKGVFGVVVFDDAGYGALRGEPNIGMPSCTDIPYPPNISMLFSACGITNEIVANPDTNPPICTMCKADEPYGLVVPIPQYPLKA